jgi:hypothetical protein
MNFIAMDPNRKSSFLRPKEEDIFSREGYTTQSYKVKTYDNECYSQAATELEGASDLECLIMFYDLEFGLHCH